MAKYTIAPIIVALCVAIAAAPFVLIAVIYLWGMVDGGVRAAPKQPLE